MDLDLKALKIDKENSQVEAKKAQNNLPNSIWETYSAFANTNGGQILLGVSEDKETGDLVVTGIDQPEKVKKEFWNGVNNPMKVSNNLLSYNDFNEIRLENGKSVFIINVPRARTELKPVFINNDIYNGSYKRIHEGDYHLTKAEISTLLRDASPTPYDIKVLDSLPLSALKDDTINKYRRYHESFKPQHPWKDLNKESYLLMIGAAGISEENEELHPTVAGLLMFGEEPTITRIFPEYFLDYRENLDPERIRWTDRFHSNTGDWTGNIFDFFLLVVNKLTIDLKVPFQLSGITRVENTRLHDAVREAFVNCLTNADYYGRSGVVVKKNRTSIVFENPGSIRVGKKQMLQGGISDSRNKTLMKMFNLLGFGERAGSGFPGILLACSEAGLPQPSIDENQELDRTSITLWTSNDISAENSNNSAELAHISAKNNSNSAELVDSMLSSCQTKYHKESKKLIDSIYSMALSAGAVTTKKLTFEFHLSERRLREVLQEMVKLGLLREEGKTKSKRYSAVILDIK